MAVISHIPHPFLPESGGILPLGDMLERSRRVRPRHWILGTVGLGLVLLGFVLFGSGCGRLVKVKGIVTLDGKPVQGAVVLFEQLGDGMPATAHTDEDGVFYLGTHTAKDGAYPGDYRVTITPPVPVPQVKYEGDWQRMSFGQIMAKYGEAKEELRKNPPKPLPFPPAVTDPLKTPLRQRVPADALVAIELESKGAQPSRISSKKSTGVDPYGKPPSRRR